MTATAGHREGYGRHVPELFPDPLRAYYCAAHLFLGLIGEPPPARCPFCVPADRSTSRPIRDRIDKVLAPLDALAVAELLHGISRPQLWRPEDAG